MSFEATLALLLVYFAIAIGVGFVTRDWPISHYAWGTLLASWLVFGYPLLLLAAGTISNGKLGVALAVFSMIGLTALAGLVAYAVNSSFEWAMTAGLAMMLISSGFVAWAFL